MKDNKIVLTFFQKLNILDKKFEEYTEIGYLWFFLTHLSMQ